MPVLGLKCFWEQFMSFHLSDNQDPWGRPGQKRSEQQGQGSAQEPKQKNDQQPPDLEEAFSSLLKKMGGGNNNGNNPSSFTFGKFLPAILGIAAVVWGVSGFYTVQEAERGVVSRFGKLHEVVMPGLNWKPTFIDSVSSVNVQLVTPLSTKGAMLTQDENMVQVEMTAQYRVEDPAKYLFKVDNPEDSLRQAIDSALRYVVGHMKMDDILTIGRTTVSEKTREELNKIINAYDMGLAVIAVNLDDARAPEEVKAAFDDAIKAQEDEQRLIREAEAYARGKEPLARGQAQRIIEQATAYKEKVVLEAKGEAARLAKLLPEYKASPELMRERLYLQTMEKVMANTPKVVMEGSSQLNVLPLDKMLNKNSVQEVKKEPVQPPSNVENTAPTPVVVEKSVQPVAQTVESVRKGRF